MLRLYIFTAAFLLLSVSLHSQLPADLQLVPKGSICAGVNYGYNAWSKYWEGETLRENGNVGTVSRQQITAGAMIGVMDRVNVILMLPYVLTRASQGTLKGQNGLQDFSLHLKGKYAEPRLGPGRFILGGVLGFSTPVSKYLVDFAPLNLGAGTTNLSYRQLINYQLDKGFFASLRANYTYRSNIPNIHRDFYFDQGQAHYSDEVRVNDILDWTGALGFSNKKMFAEISYNTVNTLGGSDIRIWDPGFPTNNMDFSTLAGRFDYYFSESGGLNLSLSGGYTLAGRNAGQAFFAGISVNYQFPVWGGRQ